MSGKLSIIQPLLQKLKKAFEGQKLKQSADLYAAIYEEDAELQELTQAAIFGWPE